MADLSVWPCESWAVDSSALAALGSQLLLQADAVDDTAFRLLGVAQLDWESPAGRNFSEYVVIQSASLRQTTDLLRDAAARVGELAAALRGFEYSHFVAGEAP